MVRKLKPPRAVFKKKQRIEPGRVPPEAGWKGAAVADMSDKYLSHVLATAPFELALLAFVVFWRTDEGKLMCIPTIAGTDEGCVGGAAAALRSIADSLDAGDYSVTEPPMPPGIGDA